MTERDIGGVVVGGIKLINLRYSDDIVLLAESANQLRVITAAMEDACIRFKMTISASKTKFLIIGRENEVLLIHLGTETVEQVE